MESLAVSLPQDKAQHGNVRVVLSSNDFVQFYFSAFSPLITTVFLYPHFSFTGLGMNRRSQVH